MLHRHREGEEWGSRRAERGAALANLDSEISELTQAKRDIDAKLSAIDDVDVERTRGEIDMLENQSDRIEREIVSDQGTLEEDRKSMHELQGIIRFEQRRQREARDLGMYQETASALVHILEQAYARIRCARRTGERQGVQVPRDEGVTNHVSPRAVRRAAVRGQAKRR